MSRAMQNITDVFRCSTQLRAKSTGMCLDWPSRCQWPPRSWRPTPTRSQPSSSTPSTRESSHEDVKLQFLDLNKRTCIEATLPSFVSSVCLAFDQITILDMCLQAPAGGWINKYKQTLRSLLRRGLSVERNMLKFSRPLQNVCSTFLLFPGCLNP